MGPRIIVVPPSAETGEIARQMAPSGFDLVLAPESGAGLEGALGAAEYMVCYPNVKMPDAFYRAAPRLKLVQLLSAGYDAVDIEAARRAKVPVSNNGGANAISATSADGGTRTILGATLALMRASSVAMLAVRTGIAKRR